MYPVASVHYQRSGKSYKIRERSKPFARSVAYIMDNWRRQGNELRCQYTLSQMETDISSLFPFIPPLSYKFTYRLASVPQNSFDSQDRLAFLVSTGSLGNHLFEKRVLLTQKVDR